MNAPPAVSVARATGYDPDHILAVSRRLLEPLGGMRAFVQPGQRVLLKPNLLGGFAVERAVTTHPAVVRAAIRLVQEAGGTALVGDSPGLGRLQDVVPGCGVAAVLAETGATLIDFTEPHDFEHPDNLIGKRLTLTRVLRGVDVVISLPKLKTHGHMTMTGALKNQYGLIPGALKGQWHFRLQQPEWLARLILDVNRIARPSLAIMDAVVAMEGPGPTSGQPRFLGALVAGADLAAVDTLACHLIGLEPLRAPILAAAREQKFGATRLEEMTLVGDDWQSLRAPDFKNIDRPEDLLRVLPLPKRMLEGIRRLWTARPRIDPGACQMCGVCEQGCPVTPSAIHPREAGRAQLDDDRCIRCYCCQEFCPFRAIALEETWLARRLPLTAIGDRIGGWLGRLKG